MDKVVKRYELQKFDNDKPIAPIPEQLKNELLNFLQSRGVNTTVKSKLVQVYEGPSKLEQKWIDLLSFAQKMNLSNETRMIVLFAYSQIDKSEQMWDLLDHWNQIDHSRYDEFEWRGQWNNAIANDKPNNKLTIASVINWVKKNNPDGYLEWRKLHKPNSWKLVDMFTHASLARYFYDKNKRKLFNSNDKWYALDKKTNLWKIKPREKKMIQVVQEFFTSKIKKHIKAKERELEILTTNGKDKSAIVGIIDLLKKQLGQIETASFAESIIKCFGDMFDRAVEMDADPYIWAFTNGIYDMKRNAFRVIEAEDYLTKTLPYEFDQTFRPDPTIVENIRSLCPTEVWKFLAYAATGETAHRTNFLYLIGPSKTGKTTLTRIFGQVLPIYYLEADPSMFDKNPTIFNKQAPQLEGKRLVSTDEVEDNEKSIAILKRITNGSIVVSPIYEMSRNLKIPSKFIFTSNDKATKMDVDQAILDRFALYEPTTSYIEGQNQKTNFVEQFKTKEYRHAYLHILIPYIQQMLVIEQLVIPNLKRNFKTHIAETNRFPQIIQDELVLTKQTTDRMTKQELLDIYEMIYPNTRISLEKIQKEFKFWGLRYERALAKQGVRGVFVGVRRKTSEEKQAEERQAEENEATTS